MTNPSALAHDETARAAASTAPLGKPQSLGQLLAGDVFDLPVLLSRCLGDRAFCGQLLGRFADRVAEQLTALDVAADANAYDLAVQAHALKGVAANLAATQLEAAAAELESRVRAGDHDAIIPLLERVHYQVARAIEAVPAVVERLESGD